MDDIAEAPIARYPLWMQDMTRRVLQGIGDLFPHAAIRPDVTEAQLLDVIKDATYYAVTLVRGRGTAGQPDASDAEKAEILHLALEWCRLELTPLLILPEESSGT